MKLVRHFSINRIGVVGAGQMGLGIAQVAAQVANISVVLVDSNHNQLEKAVKRIWDLLEKDVSKGRLDASKRDEIFSLVSTSTKLDDLNKADFIIEAVSENPDLKAKIFEKLDKISKPSTILATNTSSISITKIAAATTRQKNVIGMHFMNPVQVMKLVEIIPGLDTSNETLSITNELALKMGKTLTVSKDVPGFIANRVLMPYINEAIFVLQEGIATRDDIDTTMKLGTNVPMGPLKLADFIGLDTCLSILRVLHTQLGEAKYRPSPLLVKYVDAGYLGKKSGRGFYEY